MIEAVLRTVLEAGRLIERLRARGAPASEKPNGAGPVTEADRAADRFLRRALTTIRDSAWLSEESADDPARPAAPEVWIVDPLDGTKEFVAGLPEYSVSVAWVKNGDPVLAIVHHPVTGDVYHAERGGGAFRNRQRVRVAEGRRLLASRTEVRAGELAPFGGEWSIEPVGSTALKLARVAAGEGNVMFSRGPKWEWDVCAGTLLVREAGGRVTDALGHELRFNAPVPRVRGILAGAPEAWARAGARIRTVGLTRQAPPTGAG